MYCQERRAKIRDVLEDRPAVSIGELMSELGASHTTVARDLQALADHSEIIRSEAARCEPPSTIR
jgi:DeoR/GlpR family transcriptional regulator of sugar metabolism